jgi:hypothetical protein
MEQDGCMGQVRSQEFGVGSLCCFSVFFRWSFTPHSELRTPN